MLQSSTKVAKLTTDGSGMAIRNVNYDDAGTREQVIASFHARQASPAYQQMAVRFNICHRFHNAVFTIHSINATSFQLRNIGIRSSQH